MHIEDSVLCKYKAKLERKLKRNKVKIEKYKSDKDTLSKDGYWSLGYFEGMNRVLEDTIDDIDAL